MSADRFCGRRRTDVGRRARRYGRKTGASRTSVARPRHRPQCKRSNGTTGGLLSIWETGPTCVFGDLLHGLLFSSFPRMAAGKHTVHRPPIVDRHVLHCSLQRPVADLDALATPVDADQSNAASPALVTRGSTAARMRGLSFARLALPSVAVWPSGSTVHRLWNFTNQMSSCWWIVTVEHSFIWLPNCLSIRVI